MSDAPILGGVHTMDDLETADDFTKKHTPYLTAERSGDAVTVTVEVGHWVAHPNQPDHFIEWIALMANGAPIARFDFSAVAVSPVVTAVVNLDPGTQLVAAESCNLHGVWSAAITV